MLMLVMVVVRMDLAVEVLSLTPDERRSYSGLNRQAASVAEAPLKNTTEECIDGVVLGAAFEVGVEAAMTFDGDQWREIEFTGFERFLTTSAMGTVGKSRRCRHQREQQQGQQQGARTEHETWNQKEQTWKSERRLTRGWLPIAEQVAWQCPRHNCRPDPSSSCRC